MPSTDERMLWKEFYHSPIWDHPRHPPVCVRSFFRYASQIHYYVIRNQWRNIPGIPFNIPTIPFNIPTFPFNIPTIPCNIILSLLLLAVICYMTHLADRFTVWRTIRNSITLEKLKGRSGKRPNDNKLFPSFPGVIAEKMIQKIYGTPVTVTRSSGVSSQTEIVWQGGIEL
jgi:hypothetical protein